MTRLFFFLFIGLLSAVYILDNAGFVLISDAIQPLIQNRKAVKQKQFLVNKVLFYELDKI